MGRPALRRRPNRRCCLIDFYASEETESRRQFETRTLKDRQIEARLARCVCLRLPVEATIVSGGKPVRLLSHPAFAEMLDQPGIAMIDYAHQDTAHYGMVVSTFPLPEDRAYSPFETSVILDLPPGTLTQRTLIYAVRTHPERPCQHLREVGPVLGLRGGEPVVLPSADSAAGTPQLGHPLLAHQ